ncbi:VOC family protein [Nesterenkonia salmonea]|uniref:VOC family protein n=1 Tax=Nesterenkonia salmonea TaxID=1804987 RepID=A0A5R9B924_9MICC|nr:VOC family protein [Nesterenkonia salmonea]TLP94975.1 VOC family protein [Nesterenkonia salmonea]
MTAYVSHTTFDAENAYALSEWWKRVLGYSDMPGDPNEPGDEQCMIVDPTSGHRLLFVEGKYGPKEVKNRVHLDLGSREGARDEEIERIRRLDATVIADRRGERGPGTGWVTFADPEGNEFCLVRSPAEM